MVRKGILFPSEDDMTDQEYREYVREYLEAVQYDVSEANIDYYVWLWEGVS